MKEFFKKVKNNFYGFKLKFETTNYQMIEHHVYIMDKAGMYISYIVGIVIIFWFPYIIISKTGNWTWLILYFISPIIGFVAFVFCGMISAIIEDLYIWFRRPILVRKI